MGGNEIPYPSGRSSGRTVAFCRPRRGRGHSETVAHGERGQEWTPSDWWIRERCGYLSPHSTLNITATSREFKQALMTGETLTWWRGPPACRRGRHTRHSMCSQRACKRQWFKYAERQLKQKKKKMFGCFHSTYGAIMALAGPAVDCAWDNQPSSCALSWDPNCKDREKCNSQISESEWALLGRYVYTYEEFVIVTEAPQCNRTRHRQQKNNILMYKMAETQNTIQNIMCVYRSDMCKFEMKKCVVNK